MDKPEAYSNIKGIKRKGKDFQTWEQVRKEKLASKKPKIEKKKVKDDTSGSSTGD